MLPVIKVISLIERCSIMYRNQQFRKMGLRGYQYSFLLEICRNPGISQDQLVKKMHLDKSNIARGLEDLKENGYITKTNNPEDLRIYLLQPTDKGKQVYQEIVLVLKKQRKYLLDDFSEEEQKELLRLLYKLSDKAAQLINNSEDLV